MQLHPTLAFSGGDLRKWWGSDKVIAVVSPWPDSVDEKAKARETHVPSLFPVLWCPVTPEDPTCKEPGASSATPYAVYSFTHPLFFIKVSCLRYIDEIMEIRLRQQTNSMLIFDRQDLAMDSRFSKGQLGETQDLHHVRISPWKVSANWRGKPPKLHEEGWPRQQENLLMPWIFEIMQDFTHFLGVLAKQA